MDIREFFGMIKLKAHLKENNKTTASSDLNLLEPFKIKSKQKWTPKETHHTINTFIGLPRDDIDNVKTRKTKNSKPSLAKRDKAGMEELAERTRIIIADADKGRAVVIMSISRQR